MLGPPSRERLQKTGLTLLRRKAADRNHRLRICFGRTLLWDPIERQPATDDVDLVPVVLSDESHSLRPAEPGDAGYEFGCLDLAPEHQTGGIIRFRNAVHREAPADAEQLAGQ